MKRGDCKAHRTQHDVIVKYVDLYLKDHDAALAEYKDAHRQPDRLKLLIGRNREVERIITDYADRLFTKIASAALGTLGLTVVAPAYDPDKPADLASAVEDIPAILSAYEQFASARRGQLSSEIAAKEAELGRMLDGFLTLTNERARDMANARMDALDQEIKALQAELPGSLDNVQSLYDECCDLHNRIRECRLAMEIGSDPQKAEAARRAIREIRLSHRYEEHSARIWSKIEKITIVPNVGDTVTYNAEVVDGRCVRKENAPPPYLTIRFFWTS
jgi:hypothetical protein